MITVLNSDFPASKAEALAWLKPRLTRAHILELFAFSAADWEADSAAVLRQVIEDFPRQRVIVRSSALDESNAESSNSGVNDSIPDVDTRDIEALAAAIRKVLASYGSSAAGHQVLIQPMLDDVRWVAVV